MQVIIPMSGTGSRFKQAGYRELKPLIEVDGKPMIEHVVGLFPGQKEFLFICSREALAQTPLRSVLTRIAPGSQIAEIDPHRRGPVYAVLQAKEFIRRHEPAIVNYCDFSAVWDYCDFKRTVEKLKVDGAITAYRGFHPHSLGPNLYAYLRHQNNYLLEIAEKRCFTSNRMQEYASAGTYYFRSGDLLLRYFQKALEMRLEVNGELYASLPYNLLVEDRLRVFVYELKKFLQWGTPEDLEEYLRWSRYFQELAYWRPSVPLSATTLLPMAGEGVRFRKEGFTAPKPLVHAGQKPILEHALAWLPPSRRTIAVCQAAHLGDGNLQRVIRRNAREVQILPVDRLTSGQLVTCLLARHAIDPEAPLLIAPCDSATVYAEKRFAELQHQADCLVWTFRNHPHANRNPEQYGWVVVSPSGQIEAVLCKKAPPGPVADAQGIVGTFWFRKARFFLEAGDALLAEDDRIAGEFYVDSCISRVIEQGHSAQILPVDFYLCLGTPADVRTYEYWAEHFHSQLKARGASVS